MASVASVADGVGRRIPVTVFTGFLGAGKTTIILSLIAKLPKTLKVVLLKNEFGDVQVDSELAKESSIQVTEMTNGCMCCVLVGQMKNALLEIQETQKPDRIIIETSGSAFPAPIAWQIRSLSTNGFDLDAIITVVDVLNFPGYEDTSYTARLQAQYTDLILLNKTLAASERQIDLVTDRVNELNTDTPRVRVGKEGVDPLLVFGLHTTLFSETGRADIAGGGAGGAEDHHSREVDLVHVEQAGRAAAMARSVLQGLLGKLSKEDVYRVKGFVWLVDDVSAEADANADANAAVPKVWIVNWAFGRLDLTRSERLSTDESSAMATRSVLLTVMGTGLYAVKGVFAAGVPRRDGQVLSCG
ncbi:CobW/HypB/UreG, nucleotide-binding domain-containing protein [Entophlyctis helioformis]|nr:CobW/HypB/UreG, nucleotide-binding domain-containing protein [Entophlyctis helioformis]